MVNLSLGPIPPGIQSTSTLQDYAESLAPKELIEAVKGQIPLSKYFWKIPFFLSESINILYKLVASRNLANNPNPQHVILAERVFTVSNATFGAILGDFTIVSAYEIGKNESLLRPGSFQDQSSSIQPIIQTIRKLAVNALEEWVECYKRMMYGGLAFKQCMGITPLDPNKYICLEPDVDTLETGGELFEYLLKLAPSEITESMQYLEQYRLENREKLNEMWSGLTNEKQLAIRKITLQIIDELLKPIASRTDIDLQKNIIESFCESELFPLKQMKQEVENYERQHGQLLF
jgi:hypothetical protein